MSPLKLAPTSLIVTPKTLSVKMSGDSTVLRVHYRKLGICRDPGCFAAFRLDRALPRGVRGPVVTIKQNDGILTEDYGLPVNPRFRSGYFYYGHYASPRPKFFSFKSGVLLPQSKTGTPPLPPVIRTRASASQKSWR